MPVTRYLATALLLIGLLTSAQVTIVYLSDPAGFLNGLPKTWWYTEGARWRSPGLIKATPNVELVTVGTSMSEGFRPEMFNIPSERFLNLALSAGTIEEEATVIQYLFQHAKPKTVVWEINPSAIIKVERSTPTYQLPAYLYGNSAADLAQYLFSPTSYHAALTIAVRRWSGDPKQDVDRIYAWPERQERFNYANAARGTCERTDRSGPYTINDALFEHKAKTLLVPIVRANPDTNFVFFIPAFPDLWYWATGDEAARGVIDSQTILARALQKEPNARFMAFSDAPFNDDWSRYKDAVHHDAGGNLWEAKQIMSGRSGSEETIRRNGAIILERFEEISAKVREVVDQACWKKLSGE